MSATIDQPAGRAAAKSRRRLSGGDLRLVLGLLTGGFIVLLLGIQFYQWQQNNALREQVERSYEARVGLDRVLSLHQDLETGQRGYVLTGNPAFLQPYYSAQPQLRPALQRLREAFSGAGGHETLRQIETLSQEKIEFSQQLIQLRRQGNAATATALIASGRGQQVMDRIRALIAKLRNAEDAELRQLLKARTSARRWQPVSFGMQLLLLLFLACSYVAYLLNVRRLERANVSAHDLSARQVAIFDAATDAMMVVDSDGRIETANPAACRLFGRAERELVGQPVSAILNGGELYIGGLNDRRSHPRAEPTFQNLQGVCVDGSKFDAEVSNSVVKLANRLLTLLLVRDATERNRVERMKTQFVSTVSHELRTPLTSIRGALALLEHSSGQSLDEKPRQLLSIAKANSERLSLLIDDILDVEKLGSKDLEFDMRPVDIRDVVTRAEEENRTYAADRGVGLNVTASNSPIMVIGDENRLLQALTNLISNAAKFSPKNGIVSIMAEAADSVGRITVADHGPGIPSEFRPRLFDRFSQAREKNQSGRSGTGLGLAITKGIVDRHNGTIDFESRIGNGTRFWIELPLAAGSQ